MFTLTAAVVALGLGAGQQVAMLDIGDRAPDMKIAHWVKGEPVKKFHPGEIYVLEFWATWCGPCRQSMPHTTELQAQYRDKDVTIVGISDEDLRTVTGFLATTDAQDVLWNDKIGYTIATDPDGSVFKDYMEATAQPGIPTAFVIGRDTRIEWIGHPMGMDVVIEAVVHDEWDREAFKETLVLRKSLQQALAEADSGKAVDILDKLIVLDKASATQHRFQKFVLLLHEIGDSDAAYQEGDQVLRAAWDDGMMLNAVAWFVVNKPDLESRDLDFAMKAAVRANKLTKGKDASILDTVARIYYEKGDLKKAVKWQKKASAAGVGTPWEALIQETLEKYENEARSR